MKDTHILSMPFRRLRGGSSHLRALAKIILISRLTCNAEDDFALNLPLRARLQLQHFCLIGEVKKAMINQYRVLAFGITRQLLGSKEATIEVDGNTVGALRRALSAQFPALSGLNSLYIAVNSSYSDEDQILSATDEIALIPPVSGG